MNLERVRLAQHLTNPTPAMSSETCTNVATVDLPDRFVEPILVRSIVFDCPDPARLAAFYGELLGGVVDSTDPSWCEVHFAELPLKLAFQHVDEFVPPEWPNGQPQQIHLDLTATDLESASARAIELGARVLADPVEEETSAFQVHVDPSGHPFFCFCVER
jgi:predicted enzyme related to lactoylglutathione lyase